MLLFNKLINSGKALNKFKEFIEIQGGNFNQIKNNHINNPNFQKNCYLKKNGYIKSMDTKSIGYILSSLGAGRTNLDSNLDYSCGIEFFSKIGDKIKPDIPIFRIFGENEKKILKAEKKLIKTIKISKIKIKIYNPIIL